MSSRRMVVKDVVEIRCVQCDALLAKREGGALAIHRNDLQATFDGEFCAALVCYRPRCRKLNVIRIAPKRGAPGGATG